MQQKEIVQQWISRIWNAYQHADVEIAASLAEQALSETGDDPRLLEVAGIIAFERKDSQLCVEYISRAMFEISLSIASQLTLAKAHLRTGNRDVAELTLAFLVEMIEKVPCSMLPDLTHALAEIKRYDLALATCRAAFDRHPDDDNAAFGVAFYMHHCGHPSELIKGVIAKAISLNPGCAAYRVNMATVCCSLSQWQEAYEHACKVSDSALASLPCKCMVEQLVELFARFDDKTRLNVVRQS